MSFPLLGSPKPQFFDSSGNPLTSGTLAILNPTDDTNKASYPTADDADALTNANVNPIVLDSRGEPPTGLFGVDGEKYKLVLKDSTGTTIWTVDDIRVPQYTAPITDRTITVPHGIIAFIRDKPASQIMSQAYTRAASIVESRALLASASATATNNNNVLAALITDLQSRGVIS